MALMAKAPALLVDPNGRTLVPGAPDAAEQRLRYLLMAAFGALKGLEPGKLVDDERRLANYRNHVAVDIINALGQHAVEQYYGIVLNVVKNGEGSHMGAEPGGVQ